MEGRKEVLGLWTSGNEGAKFWLAVLTELKNRGVKDVLIACIDGLKGFPQAIESVFPQARIQLCIVHIVRATLNYVNWKERKHVAADLKTIYRASSERQAEQELAGFIAKLGAQVSSDREDVDGQLASHHTVFRVSGRSAKSNLHHQCGGIAEHEFAKD